MHRLSLRAGFVTAAFALAAATAAADTLPPRKPGLWESKVSSAETGESTVRQCIDEKTDKLAESGFGTAQACSKRLLTKTGTGYETESDCKIGPISATGKGLISGDFNSRIRIETTSILTGLPNQKEPVTRKTVIEASWVGPCEKGQSPGDVILPDGKVVKMPAASR